MCQHAWHMKKATYGVWELFVEARRKDRKKKGKGNEMKEREENKRERKGEERERERRRKGSGVLTVKTRQTKK